MLAYSFSYCLTIPQLLSLLSLYRFIDKTIKSRKYTQRTETKPSTLSPYSTIEPISNPRWDLEEPLKLRSFKSPYHLTMGLQSCNLSELLAMDRTYPEKIAVRRQILESHEADVVACNPVAREAAKELYEWVFRTYLPRRFPQTFTIYGQAHGEGDGVLHNAVTNEAIPLSSPPHPIDALKILGANVDAEFAILLPIANPNAHPPPPTLPTDSPQSPYYLHAFVLCFPSGFNTPQKLGMKLAHIHAPVPGYSAKLEKSMDRYFASLPFGKVVRRQNWSVQQGTNLFVLSGNHLSTTEGHGDEGGVRMARPEHNASAEQLKDWERLGEDVRPEECRLRCERQTLHRLERTGALVFAFKTYLYPLQEVVDEGLGAEMADAIEGLGKGSVPGVEVYKRAVVWKWKVSEWLRREHGRKFGRDGKGLEV